MVGLCCWFALSALSGLTGCWIADYEIKGDVHSATDWDERNTIYLQGMMTGIDTGRPTVRGRKIVYGLALLNATIGMIHRGVLGHIVVGNNWLECLVTIVCCILTLFTSHYVYNELFCTAFRWYTVLMFNEQLAKVLTIEGAMTVHLPCYIDLRHEGNLEAVR